MRPRAASLLRVALLLLLAGAVSGGPAAEFKDPSPHAARQVVVADGVSLEVLDWGGRGPPVVLLAGLPHTAHVFDDFAPLLKGSHHVYGVTRRGFGRSSAPEWGYASEDLGDDVVAVIDALRLKRPMLVAWPPRSDSSGSSRRTPV